MSVFNRHTNDEPLVAYVFGQTPPDFAALAASGFEVVALDSLAPWYDAGMLARAEAHGLVAVGFPMSHTPALKPTTLKRRSLA